MVCSRTEHEHGFPRELASRRATEPKTTPAGAVDAGSNLRSVQSSRTPPTRLDAQAPLYMPSTNGGASGAGIDGRTAGAPSTEATRSARGGQEHAARPAQWGPDRARHPAAAGVGAARRTAPPPPLGLRRPSQEGPGPSATRRRGGARAGAREESLRRHRPPRGAARRHLPAAARGWTEGRRRRRGAAAAELDADEGPRT